MEILDDLQQLGNEYFAANTLQLQAKDYFEMDCGAFDRYSI